MRRAVVRLTNVERGGIRAVYAASVEVNGHHVGYVQRIRGEDAYKAICRGLLVSCGHTLTEVKADVREAVLTGEIEVEVGE